MNKTKKRWLLLDNLKALIVAFMVAGHTLIWWYSYNGDRVMIHMENPYYYPLVDLFFMVINALVMSLPLTAGMALFFSLKSRTSFNHKAFLSWSLSRAAIIFGIGLVINLIAWGPAYIWTWDVLQFYAVSFLLLAFVFRYSHLAVGGIIAATCLALSQYPELGQSLPNQLQIVLWGDENGNHYWPLFPWLSIVVIGYMLSVLYQKWPQRFCITTLLSGLILAGLSISLKDSWYLIDLNNIWGPDVFMPKLSIIIMQLGMALLIIGFLEKFQSEKSRNPKSLTQSYSQGILVIYFVNIIFGFHFTRLVEGWAPSVFGLWIAVISQLIIAYYIGLAFIHLKQKLKTKA